MHRTYFPDRKPRLKMQPDQRQGAMQNHLNLHTYWSLTHKTCANYYNTHCLSSLSSHLRRIR
jgi:hypothetical protein